MDLRHLAQSTGVQLSVPHRSKSQPASHGLARLKPPGRFWIAALPVVLAYFTEAFLSGLVGETRFGFTLPPFLVALLPLPGAIALLWRRDYPRIAFAIVWVQLVLIGFCVPTFQPFAMGLVALYGLARATPLRQSLIGLALMLIPWSLITITNVLVWEDATVATSISANLVYWGATLATFAFARTQRYTHKVQDLREQTREATLALRLQEDRLTTARDLHDNVANSLAATVMSLDGLARFGGEFSEQANTHLDLTNRSARQAMHEVRELMGVLRGSNEQLFRGEVAPPDDLEETLRALQADDIVDTDVLVTSIGDLGPLPPDVEECAILSVRAAVANAERYSIDQVEIEVDWREDPLLIRVVNAAPAHVSRAPGVRGGMGLGGIIERVASVDGSVRLDVTGTTFVLELRLPRTAPSPLDTRD